MTRAVAASLIRLRWLIAAGWIVGTAASVVYLPTPGDAAGGALGSLVPENSPAVLAQRRSAELFAFPVLANTIVVQRDPSGLSAAEQARVVDRVRKIVAREYGELLSVPFALPLINTLGLVPSSREADTAALTYLFFKPKTGLQDRRKLAHWFVDRRLGVDRPTVVGATGVVPARVEQADLIRSALPLIEVATVVLIALVVGVTFRALLAPLLTLGAVGVAYLVARGLVAASAERLDRDMPREVEPLLLVLLLGIVTDYCIFLLSTARHRLADGQTRLEAAAGAARDNIRILGTAALIVAAGSAALVVARLEFFRIFGPALALAVLVGLAVSLTLAPALIAILGRALFWPGRIRPTGGRVGRGQMIGRVARSRLLATVVAVGCSAVLVAGSLRLGDARLAVTPLAGLPDESEPARAAAAAAEAFAPGTLSPTLLLVEDHALAGAPGALTRLQRSIASQPGVAAVIGPANVPEELPVAAVRSERGTAARMLVLFDSQPLGAEAADALERLRTRLPRLLDVAGLPAATVSIGGNTALAADTIEVIRGDIGRTILAVLLVNLVLLVLFLRALVAPLIVLAANALALAATLGITVVAVEALGWELTYYVPFIAAVLLVSLGSDYNIFLVGRIWQEAEERPFAEAIATATPRAAHAIRAAAIALALSFALLAIVPLWSFRELALAMAVGVVVDAFLVRSWLVPALVAILGRGAAWPGPLWRRHV